MALYAFISGKASNISDTTLPVSISPASRIKRLGLVDLTLLIYVERWANPPLELIGKITPSWSLVWRIVKWWISSFFVTLQPANKIIRADIINITPFDF